MNSLSVTVISATPTLAKIVIRVINKNREDDVLVFTPDTESNGFNVVFVQPYLNSKNEFWLDYDAVVPYVETFFQALLADNDTETCANVQVDMPGLASVLLKKDGLNKYLADVFDSQMDTFRETDWPHESSVPESKKSEIKELCIQKLISFGMARSSAEMVVNELLYESRRRSTGKSPTYNTVLEVLGKFSPSEIMDIFYEFQAVQDEDEDTDAVLLVIDLYKRHC
jgi:hypothetical protein